MNIDLEPCVYRETGTPEHWNKGPGEIFITCRHPVLKWPEMGVSEATCLQCQALSSNGQVYGPPNDAWRRKAAASP